MGARFTYLAKGAAPEHVIADVRIVGGTADAGEFVVLSLLIDGNTIEIGMPANRYMAARDVADAWGRLLDKSRHQPVTDAFLKTLSTMEVAHG